MSMQIGMLRRSCRSCVVLVLALLACVAGCQRGMYDQPRYEPLEESDFGPFENGQASRPLVPGTVARGQLRLDTEFFEGKLNGQLINTFPIAIDMNTLERGQERFEIFCSMCHGNDGLGNGMVVRRGFKRPPSLHEQRLRDLPEGHYFEVISHGFGVMPSYARIPVEDRWAIVAYVRALQKSRDVQSFTEDQNKSLQREQQAASAQPAPQGEAH